MTGLLMDTEVSSGNQCASRPLVPAAGRPGRQGHCLRQARELEPERALECWSRATTPGSVAQTSLSGPVSGDCPRREAGGPGCSDHGLLSPGSPGGWTEAARYGPGRSMQHDQPRALYAQWGSSDPACCPWVCLRLAAPCPPLAARCPLVLSKEVGRRPRIRRE